MYKKILVPLDGSELAECVLAHVESIARGCSVQDVILLRVVEPFHLYRGLEHSLNLDERERLQAEDTRIARDYLEKIASRIAHDGVNMQSEVLSGMAAESIVDYAAKSEADLVIIATHGRSGISRWAFGSVADRILRATYVPVLMVRAPGCVPGI